MYTLYIYIIKAGLLILRPYWRDTYKAYYLQKLSFKIPDETNIGKTHRFEHSTHSRPLWPVVDHCCSSAAGIPDRLLLFLLFQSPFQRQPSSEVTSAVFAFTPSYSNFTFDSSLQRHFLYAYLLIRFLLLLLVLVSHNLFLCFVSKSVLMHIYTMSQLQNEI